MSKRLFITSDWHADWHTDGYERFDDVRDNVMRVVEAAITEQRGATIVEAAQRQASGENDPDRVAFLFCGDLTNPHSRNVHRAMALAAEADALLRAAGIERHWVVGNHDVIEDGRGSHTLMHLAHGGAFVWDQPGEALLLNEFNLVVLPFVSLAQPYDPDQWFRQHGQGADVVVGHLHIPGIVPGSETNAMPRGRVLTFPREACRELAPKALLVNGHYHQQQTFDGIHIPGALVALTHGEESNTPGYLVVQL